MRLALYSDLHLEMLHPGEFVPPTDLDVDLVLLAGDIHKHTYALDWAYETFCLSASGSAPTWDRPRVAYIAGNHEYYRSHLGLLAQLKKHQLNTPGVRFLECDVLHVTGRDGQAVRILGCTLWSDFQLHGTSLEHVAMADAQRIVNDYRLIEVAGGSRLEPQHTLRMFQKSMHWLTEELARPFDGKTVVMTHFAPHPACVAPEYRNSPVSPYFVSDCSHLMRQHKIDVWVFGHTHGNVDEIVDGGCRLISNQRGYRHEDAYGIGFRPGLVIDLGA